MKLMLVISFLVVFAFGFRIFSKNLDELSEKNHISERSMTKIVAQFLFLFVVGLFFAKFSPLFVPIFCAFGIFSVHCVVFFQSFMRNRALRAVTPALIDSILLQMTIGDSLRTATERSLRRLPPSQRDRFHYLLFVSESRNHLEGLDSRVQFFCFAYHRATKQTFMAKKILASTRERFHIEDRFRGKISQVLAQVRVQIVFLALLFLAAVIFQIRRPSAAENARLIGISVFIYIVGVALSLWIPRRHSWNM